VTPPTRAASGPAAGEAVPAIPADAAGEGRKLVQVEIFGHSYTIRGEAAQDYIVEVAKYVDAHMRDVTEKLPVASLTKVAVLASLNIADELFRERAERAREEQQVSLRVEQLRAQLDQVLRDGEGS
jgi:cell division protein ZapA